MMQMAARESERAVLGQVALLPRLLLLGGHSSIFGTCQCSAASGSFGKRVKES